MSSLSSSSSSPSSVRCYHLVPSVTRDTGTDKTFVRSSQCENLLFQEIRSDQQMNSDSALTDATLICNGGTVKVHTIILQAVSPFFHSMFMSQGENYPFIREILMLDFSIKDIENVVGLIYGGCIYTPNMEDLESLQEVLDFFQMPTVGLNGSAKFDKVQEIETPEFNSNSDQDVAMSPPKRSDPLAIRQSRRARKPTTFADGSTFSIEKGRRRTMKTNLLEKTNRHNNKQRCLESVEDNSSTLAASTTTVSATEEDSLRNEIKFFPFPDEPIRLFHPIVLPNTPSSSRSASPVASICSSESDYPDPPILSDYGESP